MNKNQQIHQNHHEKMERMEADRLGPGQSELLVKEAVTLEARRSELQAVLGETPVLKQRVDEIEIELKELRAEYTTVLKQIMEAEEMRGSTGRGLAGEYEELNQLRVRQEQLKQKGSEKRQTAEDLYSRLDAMSRLSDELSQVEKRIEMLKSDEENSNQTDRIKTTRIEGEEKARRSAIARAFLGEEAADGSLCPPRAAEFIAYLLPKKRRDPLLGDVQEIYLIAYEKFGKFWGPLWYWLEVFRSVSVLVIKWGIIGVIIESIRKAIR